MKSFHRVVEFLGWVVVFTCLLLLASGCKMLPPAPQKGSSYTAKLQQMALVQTPDAPQLVPVGEVPQLNFEQGENQETPSEQVYERTIDGTRVTESIRTSMGTAQHDRARDDWASVAKLEAKLRSYGSIKLLGFGLLLAALAMFHPAIRSFTGTTVQVWTGAAGAALIFGAQMLAGNETLVLILVCVGGGAIYMFRRHGYLQGMVDANKNGIPDALEAVLAKLNNKQQEK